MAKGVKTGGRKKGTPNHTTDDMRRIWTEAFHKVSYDDKTPGGVASLVAWGSDNPTEFYKLAARLIPQQQIHSGDAEKPIQHEHAVIRWGDMEIPI